MFEAEFGLSMPTGCSIGMRVKLAPCVPLALLSGNWVLTLIGADFWEENATKHFSVKKSVFGRKAFRRGEAFSE